ncbi:MAG: nickel pincer cofactor biosynthesis protein LarB [Planctomycetota bacterium]
MSQDPLQDLLRAAVPGGSGTIDLGHSTLDRGRAVRCGTPEIVYGAGKAPNELVDIVRALHAEHGRVLATRVTDEGAAALVEAFGDALSHDARARCARLGPNPDAAGLVAVVCAGTSDRAVALEAAHTARFLGAEVDEINDVGVAGLHRILEAAPRIRDANAIVVVAGMEGALPSVVGGLVDKPVIAVPTSVGYGAAFGGLAALLGMLNSCASGVTVVNIDNGFGGAYAAAQINRVAVAAARNQEEEER